MNLFFANTSKISSKLLRAMAMQRFEIDIELHYVKNTPTVDDRDFV